MSVPVPPTTIAVDDPPRAGPIAQRAPRRLTRGDRAARLAPVWVLAGFLVAGVALAAIARPDPARAWAEAEGVLARELVAGERVLVGTRVLRRHWWDHFRATHGVLAATDRRLLYVGVIPPSLLRPRESGPPLLERSTFAYDPEVRVRSRGLLSRLWGAPGLVVRSPAEDATFAVASEARDRTDAIARIATEQQGWRTAADARERVLLDSIAALPAPDPMTHVVRRGETVIMLANRFGFTPDEFIALNSLPNDRLRAGQRLVVRRFQRVEGVLEEY